MHRQLNLPILEPHKIEISSIKYNYAGRVRFDETGYFKITDHIYTPNPEALKLTNGGDNGFYCTIIYPDHRMIIQILQ